MFNRVVKEALEGADMHSALKTSQQHSDSKSELILLSRRSAALAVVSQSLFIAACGKKDETSSDQPIIDWAGLFLTTFESLGSNTSSIAEKAKNYNSVTQWRRVSDFDVTTTGGLACAVPLAGLATIPVEFGYLMRQIYDSALGIGIIVYGNATKDDFASILAQWCNEFEATNPNLARVYAASEAAVATFGVAATKVAADHVADRALTILNQGTTAAANATAKAALGTAARQVPEGVISNVLAHYSGNKVLGKLSAKVAAKLGIKFGAKYGTKALTSWIPVISGVVCGGVNWWIMDGILDTAEKYFTTLNDFRDKRYGK